MVPNFDAIRDDPKFSEFLSQIDATSGRTYFNMAQEADTNLDYYRLASFYLAFKRINGVPATEGSFEYYGDCSFDLQGEITASADTDLKKLYEANIGGTRVDDIFNPNRGKKS